MRVEGGILNKLLYEEISYKVRGCLFEVYNNLGPGLKEAVYQNAVACEFNLHNIPFESQRRLVVRYEAGDIGSYVPDFVIDGKMILESQALPEMPKLLEKQLYYYLRATGYIVGFLVNFGGEKLDIRWRVLDEKRTLIS